MYTFRVFFEKDGIKFTKLVTADRLHDVFEMYKGQKIIDVKIIDTNLNTESINTN